ncbi:Lysyl oxidase-like 4 [Holothuria leucospilota]|uniref:Lysyl oxidase-like 4 n=1 Tax=Holothuria leucospilota TaxID=206669 RepID=A0A9Q1HMB0_HOLLE|nr:Lysyl oxidase-like 4 [Holothuria leucospilota]
MVACQQLGFQMAILNYSNAFFGKGVLPHGLQDIRCIGNETSLLNCNESRSTRLKQTVPCVPHPFSRKMVCGTSTGVNACTHRNDVGVLCGGKLKLFLYLPTHRL